MNMWLSFLIQRDILQPSPSLLPAIQWNHLFNKPWSNTLSW
jgi:hypothetical protein